MGEGDKKVKKELFFFLHHCIAHPFVYLIRGRVFAWRFHDWTGSKAWPQSFSEEPVRWAGLE